MRSCLKVILKKMGIPVDDSKAAPSPVAIRSYEQEFLRGLSRSKISALAMLYGWILPSELELQSQEIAAENSLVTSGREVSPW
jgi:hypothetical protein